MPQHFHRGPNPQPAEAAAAAAAAAAPQQIGMLLGDAAAVPAEAIMPTLYRDARGCMCAFMTLHELVLMQQLSKGWRAAALHMPPCGFTYDAYVQKTPEQCLVDLCASPLQRHVAILDMNVEYTPSAGMALIFHRLPHLHKLDVMLKPHDVVKQLPPQLRELYINWSWKHKDMSDAAVAQSLIAAAAQLQHLTALMVTGIHGAVDFSPLTRAPALERLEVDAHRRVLDHPHSLRCLSQLRGLYCTSIV